MPFDKSHIQKLNSRNDRLRKTMTPYMSNTKWRKLFTSLDENDVIYPICDFKFIGEENIRRLSTPDKDCLEENAIPDIYVTGPFHYNEIEWIKWPKIYEVSRGPGLKPWVKEQDLYKLKQVIDNTAMFEYDLTDERIKLYGYKTTKVVKTP